MTYNSLTRKIGMLLWWCEEELHHLLTPNEGNTMSSSLDKKSKKIIRQYARVMFDQAVERCRTHYRMPKDWDPLLKTRFAHGSSWADGDGILLSFQFEPDDLVNGGRYWDAPEYTHIKDREHIGSFMTKDWRVVVKSLIAHELAHNIDWIKTPHKVWKRAHKGNGDGSHGRSWQDRYLWITLHAWEDSRRIPTNRCLGTGI